MSQVIKTILQVMAIALILQVGYNAIVPKPIKRTISFIIKQIGLLITKGIFPIVKFFFNLTYKFYCTTIDIIFKNLEKDEEVEDKKEVEVVEEKGTDDSKGSKVVPIRREV